MLSLPFEKIGQTSCSGPCLRCNREHVLGAGPARAAAFELMERLERERRIDFSQPADQADPRFATGYLFGPARGQMFGVLVGRRADGSEEVLRAFSGQYDGVWSVEGWAGPLFAVEEMARLCEGGEREIKRLGAELDQLAAGSAERTALVRQRRFLSRQLMKEIHARYRLTNFRGETRPLAEVFIGSGGMPTGTGDCCGPKLLHLAAQRGLTPLGLAEFYWGQQNFSASRRHGLFYPACESKCRPIMGFLLCGLEERQ